MQCRTGTFVCCFALTSLAGAADLPTTSPAESYKQKWTNDLKWSNVVNVDDFKGATLVERFNKAQDHVGKNGGGVVYFPPGVHQVEDWLKLKSGVVIRGADPKGVTDARKDNYDPRTKLIFPRYKPKLSGNGAPISTAFKGIVLDHPATASNCGVVNVSINFGHVHFPDDGTDKHACGRNRIVLGCVLRNAAVADPAVPEAKIGQRAWQRFTARHHAAVLVRGENLLVANNRLPASGEGNFTMKNYVVRGRKTKMETLAEVVFDYDNRPGLYVNDYGIGASGGQSGNDGTPKSHPWGFRKGILIADNYVYCTGRCAIAFCGDGVICRNNVIRFKKDVHRPTATGRNLTTGSSSNDNRAVQMRGWRWTVQDNDYEVYRNLCADRSYYINDGEGLMHEDHVNSTILDAKLINNKGNSYLSLYKTGGINGLIVKGNVITTKGGIAAIYVNANRNSGRHECRNVTIEDNVTRGSGILIAVEPASNNQVRNNRHVGNGGVLVNQANAKLVDNNGYHIERK